MPRPRESREIQSKTIEDFEFDVKGTNKKDSVQEHVYRTRSGQLSKPSSQISTLELNYWNYEIDIVI